MMGGVWRRGSHPFGIDEFASCSGNDRTVFVSLMAAQRFIGLLTALSLMAGTAALRAEENIVRRRAIQRVSLKRRP